MSASTARKPNGRGKDLAEFRASFDPSYIVPQKIKKALAELGARWEEEAVFIKRCGTSLTYFARYRDRFMEHCVKTPGVHGKDGKRVWAGTKAYAKTLRKTLGQ